MPFLSTHLPMTKILYFSIIISIVFFVNQITMAQDCLQLKLKDSLIEFHNIQDSTTAFQKEIDMLTEYWERDELWLNNDYSYFKSNHVQVLDIKRGKFYSRHVRFEEFEEKENNPITNPEYGIECDWKVTGKKKEINGFICDEILIPKLEETEGQVFFYVYPEYPNINIHGFKKPLPGLLMKEQRWMTPDDETKNAQLGSTLINITYNYEQVPCPDEMMETISKINDDFLLSKILIDTLSLDEPVDPLLVKAINFNYKFKGIEREIFAPGINNFIDSDKDIVSIFKEGFEGPYKAFSKNENVIQYIIPDRYKKRYDTIQIFYNGVNKIMDIKDSKNQYHVINDTILFKSDQKFVNYYYDESKRTFYEFRGKQRALVVKKVYDSDLRLVEDLYDYNAYEPNNGYSLETSTYKYDSNGNMVSKTCNDLSHSSDYLYGSNGLEYAYFNNGNHGSLTYNIQYTNTKESKFVVKKLSKNSKYGNTATIYTYDEKYNLTEIKRDNGYNSKWILKYEEE